MGILAIAKHRTIWRRNLIEIDAVAVSCVPCVDLKSAQYSKLVLVVKSVSGGPLIPTAAA